MRDGGLAAWLGPSANQALLDWAGQQHLHHKLDRAFDNGGTEAKVAIVDRHYLVKGYTEKLVLKFNRFTGANYSETEYARHYEAAHKSGPWAKKHLARLVDPPISVGSGWWIVFQSVAGELDRFEVLSSLLRGFDQGTYDAVQLAAAFEHVVHGVLAEWVGPPEIAYYTVPDFLRAHLSYRLGPGKPLVSLVESSTEPAFALLQDAALTEGIEISAPRGKSHGDLHVENAMVRVRPAFDPADYRLIDLANFEDPAPLARDPAHLIMHMVNLSLEDLGERHRRALREVLLDPESKRKDQLPNWITNVITATYEAAENWLEPSGFASAWRRDRPLSLYAAALMVYVRRNTRPQDKEWLLEFARDAMRLFLDSVGGRQAQTAEAPSTLHRPARHAKLRAEKPAKIGGEKFVVGRVAEARAFDRLVGGEDDHLLLNIYGPGGIGKSVVFDKLAAHADGRGILVGSVDVGAHGDNPSEILRELARGFIQSTATDPFCSLIEQSDIYASVRQIADSNGGLDAMFETVGTPKDQAALRAALCNSSIEIPMRIQEQMFNRFSLGRYLRNFDRTLTAEFGDLLGAMLDGARAALLLDTYEEVGTLDEWVRRTLLPVLPDGVKLVVLGRNELSKQNIDWADHGDVVRTHVLPELAEEEAKSYLRHYGLQDPVALTHIYGFTGGYPLLLVLVRQLAKEAGGWEAVGEMEHSADRDLIARRLLDRILREERVHAVKDVLEKCAVASWVNPEIIVALLDVSPSTARELFDRVRVHSFMERHPDGVRLHEKIRALLIERLQFTSQHEFDRLQDKLLAYHAERSSGLKPSHG